jgi:hypothetical protein
VYDVYVILGTEPEFVNLINNPEIDSQPGGIEFLGSLNFYNVGLWVLE